MQTKILYFIAAAVLVTLGVSGIGIAYSSRVLEAYREPRFAALADLEQGALPASFRLELDEHWEIREEYGTLAAKRDAERLEETCFPLLSIGSRSNDELADTEPSDWSAETHDAIRKARVFVVTRRYHQESEITGGAERTPRLGGTIARGEALSCKPLWKEWGVSGEDAIVIREGKGGSPPSFGFFAGVGFLFLLAAPFPVIAFFRKGRAESSAGPYPSSPPPRASSPPHSAASPYASASTYPSASARPSAAPIGLAPGSRVLVRRGEERIEAQVLVVEAGRCRCEFSDGKQAWVLIQDVERA